MIRNIYIFARCLLSFLVLAPSLLGDIAFLNVPCFACYYPTFLSISVFQAAGTWNLSRGAHQMLMFADVQCQPLLWFLLLTFQAC